MIGRRARLQGPYVTLCYEPFASSSKRLLRKSFYFKRIELEALGEL